MSLSNAVFVMAIINAIVASVIARNYCLKHPNRAKNAPIEKRAFVAANAVRGNFWLGIRYLFGHSLDGLFLAVGLFFVLCGIEVFIWRLTAGISLGGIETLFSHLIPGGH